MIGKRVLHYEILEELGRGGMGVVYKARDTRLDRPVALKFLSPHLHASEQEKARFLQEAKAAAALNHPNICSVIDVQEVEGATPAEKQLFIVMEYIEGQTLKEKVQGTGLRVQEAINFGIQIADGLAAAHEKGIVHRDIKPENIMVRKDGIVQIMDFGLAKLRSSRVTRLTREGSTVGTAGFMSPEQVAGQEVDHRSDIFSLGVLLYEMLTGQLPFKGVHETALLYEIVNVDPPSMSTVKPDIDPELDRIGMECLEKEPSERYQSAAEIAKDLRRVKRESGRQRVSRSMPAVETRPQPGAATAAESVRAAGGRPLPLMIVSALLVCSLVALGWSLLHNGNTPPPVVRFSFSTPINVARMSGSSALTISPDGKYIAWLGGSTTRSELLFRPLDQLLPQSVAGTEGALDPFFSPDGQWLCFQSGGKLEKISVFGGAPQVICDVQGLIRGGWWGRDNFIYFGEISSSIMRVSPNGGTPQAVTSLDTTKGEMSHRFPELLPDGKTLIFTVKLNNIATFNDAFILAQRLGSGERKVLVRGGTCARYLPDGHLVYARGRELYAVPFDADRLEVTGAPVELLEGGLLNEFSGSANYAFSSAGTLAYAAADPLTFDRWVISWMDRNGKVRPLLDDPHPYAGSALSPDGQKLAVIIQAANDDIWLYHIQRKTLTRLTFEGGNHAYPVWSPDGGYIYYSAEHGRSANLFRKVWDGSGTEERLTQSPEAQFPLSCSPDGKVLAFDQGSDIWMHPLTGDGKPWPFIQSPAEETGAAFSPDGRYIAYSSNESGKREIYVVPFPDKSGKWQVSTNGGVHPHWSRDGRELSYLNGTTLMAAQVTLKPSFDFSVAKKLCDLPANVTAIEDASPDGKEFVVRVSRGQDLMTAQVNVVIGWFNELREKFRGKAGQ